jgi:flagellar protein FlaI
MRLWGGKRVLQEPPSSRLDDEIYEKLEKRGEREGSGFELPPFHIKISHADPGSLKTIDSYPMGPSMVYITEDYGYFIHDPVLTTEEKGWLMGMASKLLFLMPVSIVTDEGKFEEYLARVGLNEDRFRYFLRREIFGYGALEPMVMDPKIEDVVVAASGRPVSCIHSSYGTMPTNVIFTSVELDRFIEKLVHLSGRSVSHFRPLISIRLPNGGRLSLSYKREVSPDGSSFIIRKFPEKPWSITSLMLLNTLPPEMAAWLMLLEEHRKAFLISGAMGTGKTSLINALCNLMPERSVIITIEDTAELRLAHPNRFSLVVRASSTMDEKGEIGMFALVKEALRMSADHLIVGEVRGEEARIWAQAIMTGHGGITSLHAEDPYAAIERLLSPPLSVERGALKSLSGIISVAKIVSRCDGKLTQRRRVLNFYDVGPRLELTPLFEFNHEADSFSYRERSLLESNSAKRIMRESGLNESTLLDMFLRRVAFLRRLMELSKQKTEFLDYQVVTRAAWAFQSSPDGFDPGTLALPEQSDELAALEAPSDRAGEGSGMMTEPALTLRSCLQATAEHPDVEKRMPGWLKKSPNRESGRQQ